MPAYAIASLSVSSGQAGCGQTLIIPITVSNAAALDAYGMKFVYDDAKLEYVSTSAGAACSDWASVSANLLQPGQLLIGGFKGSGTALTGNGELVLITLQCKTSTCPSQSTITVVDLVDDLSGASVSPGTADCTSAPSPTFTPTPRDSSTHTPTPTASFTPSPTSVSAVTLAVGSGQAGCGQTMVILITVSNASALDAYGMKLVYDDAKLEYVSVAAGAACSNWASVSGNLLQPGELLIGGFKGSGTAVNGSGELVRVTLRCNEANCPFQSTITVVDLVDDLSGASVSPGTADCTSAPSPTFTPTELPIPTVLNERADIDENGVVDYNDLLLLQRNWHRLKP